MDKELRYSTKKAHMRIFSKGQGKHTLDSTVTQDGSVSTKPEDIIKGTETHFRNTGTPTVAKNLAGRVP